MKEYRLKPPEISQNSADSFNALHCLQHLYDADLISELLLEYITVCRLRQNILVILSTVDAISYVTPP
jgi:hypothetical protein